MIDPTEKDIGRKVYFTGYTHPGAKIEEGVITSFNDECVFVRYEGRLRSEATSRQDLEWSFPKKGETK